MRAKILNNLWLYGISTLLTGLILAWAMGAPNVSFYIPFAYRGDAMFAATIIKSIVDTGQYVTNPFLGAPLGYNIAEYPIYDIYNFIVIRFLALFSHDYAVVLNAFYCSTYFFVAWLALFVFQRLGINRVFALVASLLFTFIPYHLMRGEDHLWVNVFLAAPIYVLLAFDVYHSEISSEKTKRDYLKNLGYLLLCILAAASSAAGYFAFFGCYFLLVAGVVASIDKKKWYPLKKACAWVGLSIVVIMLSLTPDFISHYKYGHNPESADRVAFDSEHCALKITQLLLPIDNHRVHPFRIFKENYNRTAPFVNENRTSSLGIIGGMGFILLLLMLFVRRWAASKNTLFTLSIFNMSALLLGMMGGFGSLFAYTISPIIRSYNRISVYVAFFSLAAFFLALQYLLKRKSLDKSNKHIAIIAISLLVFGLFDQIPRYAAYQNYTQKETYRSDQEIIKQIEKIMPPQSMIFELPYTIFPESVPLNDLDEDELIKGYLHSHTLRWSYGAMRGRFLTKWQQTVSHQPVPMMLKNIVFAGFTGLYINRSGYKDHGRMIEQELDAQLHVKPLISLDNRIIFYDLRPYASQLKKSMDLNTWNQNVNQIFSHLLLSSKWYRGFYELDDVNPGVQWANSRGILKITNFHSEALPVKINFRLQSHFPKGVNVYLSGDLIKEKKVVDEAGTIVTKQLILSPGQHEIIFNTDAKKDMSKNKDHWYFRADNFTLERVMD